MPIMCFAFYYESMLIPVSNAFTVKDHNGALGLRSSLLSLTFSFVLYATLIPMVAAIQSSKTA